MHARFLFRESCALEFLHIQTRPKFHKIRIQAFNQELHCFGAFWQDSAEWASALKLNPSPEDAQRKIIKKKITMQEMQYCWHIPTRKKNKQTCESDELVAPNLWRETRCRKQDEWDLCIWHLQVVSLREETEISQLKIIKDQLKQDLRLPRLIWTKTRRHCFMNW